MAMCFVSTVVAGAIFCLLLPDVTARYPQGNEGALRDYLFNHANYSTKERPVFNYKDTVYVRLGLQFYAMLDLNERDQIITTASWVTLDWQDERLTWDPAEFDGIDLLILLPEEVWTPKVFLANSFSSTALGVVSSDRGAVLLTSDGAVNYGSPFVQATSCPISIQYFPFDTQACPFQFFPENSLVEQMHLYTSLNNAYSTLDSSEWDLLNVTTLSYVYPVPNLIPNRPWSNYSAGEVCVFLKRDPGYYITTLIVPSTFLCLMSIMTFLTPPDSGERLSLGISMVLGLTVFQILVADTLPTASKDSPILGNYLTYNFVLCCLSVPFSLININVALGDTRPKILEFSWGRGFLLFYVPKVLLVPTYRERVRNEIVEVEAFTEENNEIRVTSVEDFTNENKIEPKEVAPPIKETLSIAERTKIEARTLSTVMDRIGLLAIIILFLILVGYTFIGFTSQPQVDFNLCTVSTTS